MEYSSPFSVYTRQLPISATVIPPDFSDLILSITTSKNSFLFPCHPPFHPQTQVQDPNVLVSPP